MNARTRNIFLIIGAIITFYLAWYFRSIVTYIVIAAVLSVIGRPVVSWLNKIKIWKFKLGESLSALITLVAIWVFFFAIFRFLIPLLVSEFDELANVDINEYLALLEGPANTLTKFVYGESISLTDGSFIDMFGEKVAQIFKVSQVTDLFGTIASTMGGLMMGLFSVSFITFFFLRDKDLFKNGLLLFVPVEYEERVAKSFDRVGVLLRRYFVGIIIEILMVMTLDTVGLTIVGLDFSDAVVIGLFCGLFNVIPYLGPWIGAAFGILIGLAININANFIHETLPLVGFMVVVFGTVQIIDNVLFQPLIYSSSVKAHPMEIFLVIIAAGSFAGITGMVLAIPVYTILRVFGAEFFSQVKIIRKLTENMEVVDKPRKKLFKKKDDE